MDPLDAALPRPIIDSRGNFQNPFHRSDQPSFLKYIKYSLQRKLKVPPQDELDLILPVLRPDWNKLLYPPSILQSVRSLVQTTWIGHATFFVQMEDGVNFLTDPHFSER
jgi:hypothetical protein